MATSRDSSSTSPLLHELINNGSLKHNQTPDTTKDKAQPKTSTASSGPTQPAGAKPSKEKKTSTSKRNPSTKKDRVYFAEGEKIEHISVRIPKPLHTQFSLLCTVYNTSFNARITKLIEEDCKTNKSTILSALEDSWS
jgi:hypothetical protein